MKKLAGLLILSALIAMTTGGPVRAENTCGFPYPCSFVDGDCDEAGGTLSLEYISDCIDVTNVTRQLYSYTCNGRHGAVLPGGTCYI